MEISSPAAHGVESDVLPSVRFVVVDDNQFSAIKTLNEYIFTATHTIIHATISTEYPMLQQPACYQKF